MAIVKHGYDWNYEIMFYTVMMVMIELTDSIASVTMKLILISNNYSFLWLRRCFY